MKKQAFTLAEILIVLMIIGAIAAISIPSLMKGIYQTQWRSGYKKAFNVIKNMYAGEKFGGSSIGSSDINSAMILFDAMYNNITRSGVVEPFALDEIKNGKSASARDIHSSVAYVVNGKKIDGELDATSVSDSSPWIISDDNIAYCVVKGDLCKTTSAINASKSHLEALKNSCVAVIADVNGLQNSPNSIQDEQNLDADESTPQLTSDRFYIYVGADGITAGPKKYSLSGRIASDIN